MTIKAVQIIAKSSSVSIDKRRMRMLRFDVEDFRPSSSRIGSTLGVMAETLSLLGMSSLLGMLPTVISMSLTST